MGDQQTCERPTLFHKFDWLYGLFSDDRLRLLRIPLSLKVINSAAPLHRSFPAACNMPPFSFSPLSGFPPQRHINDS